MRVIWPPRIPPEPGYPTWFGDWLAANFDPEIVIQRHCETAGINRSEYVPVPADAYLLRCSLAELLLERGHGAAMVGDRIQIDLDMGDSTVRVAAGLK